MTKTPTSAPDPKISRASAPLDNRWQAFWKDHERRDRWLTTALLAAFAVGGFAMWRSTRQFVLRQDAYQVDPEDVEITPAPIWIRSDVREEALRQGGLEPPPSLLNSDLVERVAKAFEAHPWVERVDRVVKKHPSLVEVDLVYRRPVCMVDLPEGYKGVFPVDAYGVVLPTNDFTPELAMQYPRLSGVAALPTGKVGSIWGDAAVLGGASLAAVLADQWKPLQLQKIMVDEGQQARGGSFEIVGPNDVRIIWGHAPSAASDGEPAPAEKLAALQHALAKAAPGTTIDLRQPLAGAARTAAAPDASPPR